MAADKTFVIKFEKDEDVVCELVEETSEVCKYKITKFTFDSETYEKVSLTVTVEISPMTDREKRSALFYSMFWGKKPSGEIIITAGNPKKIE